MLGTGFHYHLLLFNYILWFVLDVDQILHFGPLIYCRNTFNATRNNPKSSLWKYVIDLKKTELICLKMMEWQVSEIHDGNCLKFGKIISGIMFWKWWGQKHGLSILKLKNDNWHLGISIAISNKFGWTWNHSNSEYISSFQILKSSTS